MPTFFLVLITSMPLYAVLIWQFYHPREATLWGKRWMYKEEPEVSEDAIQIAKVASIIAITGITLLLLILFIKAL